MEPPADPADLKCPRCRGGLARQRYEGVEVEFCAACWGYWLDRGELKAILKTRALQFSEEERDAILKEMARETARHADTGAATEPAPCARCGKRMHPVRVQGTPVRVDLCREHGVWLDTGELKALQIFNESQTPAALKSQRSAFGRLLTKVRT